MLGFIGQPHTLIYYYTNDLVTFQKAWGSSQDKDAIQSGSCALVHVASLLDDLPLSEYKETPLFFDILNMAYKEFQVDFVYFSYHPDREA